MSMMAFAVKSKPLNTPLAIGRNAAQKALAPGERVTRRDFRSLG